jgi:hypothetical protein
MNAPGNPSDSVKRLNPALWPPLAPEAHFDAERLSGEPKAEKDLHNAIIAHCKARGWIYFHGSMAHKTFRTIAEPDFILMSDNGRVFFIECKTQNGKLTAEQEGLRQWAYKLGHFIHTVRSFEAFLELVTACEHEKIS